MIGLRPATEEDKLHLQTCFSLDIWHKKEAVENWLAQDITTVFNPDGSPLFHLCFTEEGQVLRLHAQFDPREKYRTAKAIPQVLDWIASLARKQKIERLVFWSASPRLISVLCKLGFRGAGEVGAPGDYFVVLSESPIGNSWDSTTHYCRFGLGLDPENEDPYQKGNFGTN